MSIRRVPPALAVRHGGDKLEAMGRKWCETFELWAGLTASDSVLDIGCGPGRMAAAIGERFQWKTPNYIGFDITPDDIAFAQNSIGERHPQFAFHCINVRNDLYRRFGWGKAEAVAFPAPNDSVSFCLATSIFTHFYKSEVERYLQETHRCLKPGGRFFSTWFLLDGPLTSNPRFTFAFENSDGTRSETETSRREAMAFRYDDVVALLERAGFTNLQYHRGAWRRDEPGARHAQDTLVAVKP